MTPARDCRASLSRKFIWPSKQVGVGRNARDGGCRLLVCLTAASSTQASVDGLFDPARS